MSARKIGHSEFYRPVAASNFPARLNLPASAVRLRKNGIEFRSQTPITTWTEIDLTLETTLTAKKFHCNGVVVACDGNNGSGYTIAVVFTDLSRQAQARLDSLVYSGLASARGRC